jgi:carbonic anhydrase
VKIEQLLEHNRRWAAERTAIDPGYFHRLAALQTPQFLWIGCADSRVPANVITGLEPGEVFVHRNVANLVASSDLNCMAVLQFAVEVLGVTDIIVCGHYGCGGVRAALDGARHGLIDHWLQPIRDLARTHRASLERLAMPERIDRCCELNVEAQVRVVAATPILQDAWATGRDVAIHGWIYGLEDGLIRDLGCTARRPR